MTNYLDKANAAAQGVINSLEGEEDHFHIIALIIGNLAAYLADTVD